MEGRKALPKSPPHSAMAARRLDSFSGDRSHRQVIEAIRAGNNDEFFEAMESGEGWEEGWGRGGVKVRNNVHWELSCDWSEMSCDCCTGFDWSEMSCDCCTGFDVNFMDDVGQTLLNWAAAFGTYEMVGIRYIGIS